MKRLIPVLLAALLMLSGCGSPESPIEPQQCPVPVSSEVSSAPEISSEAESAASSEAASSETVSSEIVSSEPVSSEMVSSEVTVLPPVESEAIPELACPLASSQSFSQEQAPVTSDYPTASEPASPSQTETQHPTVSEEEPLRMTEAEADALVQQGIAYAESLGMTWHEAFSIAESGYYPPAYTEEKGCWNMLRYNINTLYELSVDSNFYQEGDPIYYKIEKGQIEDFPGWFIYVLY